jgi:hypothetical protein
MGASADALGRMRLGPCPRFLIRVIRRLPDAALALVVPVGKYLTRG